MSGLSALVGRCSVRRQNDRIRETKAAGRVVPGAWFPELTREVRLQALTQAGFITLDKACDLRQRSNA